MKSRSLQQYMNKLAFLFLVHTAGSQFLFMVLEIPSIFVTEVIFSCLLIYSRWL